jgi:phosphoglycolate phosphatase
VPLLVHKIAIDLIVFDLDGTLADSLPDLAQAANYACRTLNLAEHSPEAIKGMIGGGEKVFVGRFLGPGNEGYLKEALRLYLEHYSRHLGDLTRLYPGVRETLKALAASGKRLAVLSNKLERLTRGVLQVMSIESLFAASRGGGGELALKPSPEALSALVRDMKADPRRTLMVGDKPADILAGRGAGAFTGAVTYGYGDPAALRAENPDFLISQISHLREIVA